MMVALLDLIHRETRRALGREDSAAVKDGSEPGPRQDCRADLESSGCSVSKSADFDVGLSIVTLGALVAAVVVYDDGARLLAAQLRSRSARGFAEAVPCCDGSRVFSCSAGMVPCDDGSQPLEERLFLVVLIEAGFCASL